MYNNNNDSNNNNLRQQFCGKTFFVGFQKINENKRTFIKKAVLHRTTLTYCKARQVLRDLFSTNHGNDSV